MALINNNSNLSDGEIEISDEDDSYSIISSEEDESCYKNIEYSEMAKRKIELELQNELEKYDDDFSKENRTKIKGNKKISSSYSSGTTSSKKTELLNRSYSASSVFSSKRTTISKRKRRKSFRHILSQQQSKKYKNSVVTRKQNKICNDDDNEEIIEDNIEKEMKEDDEDEEFELIALRLNALKSKQELKDIEKESSPNKENNSEVPEEELLRIDALKSALLRKKELFKTKKEKRKQEKERPYSPTDNLSYLLDDPMELSNSPLQSPSHESISSDINQEVDMEISNSPIESPSAVIPYADIETATSPMPLEKLMKVEDDEEENALRQLLLSSLKNKQNEKIDIAKNLKLALERIRHLKKVPATHPQIPQVTKSGTKTIKMILEEKKKNKKKENLNEDKNEKLLIEKISTSSDMNLQLTQLTKDVKKESILADEVENSCSTITDTKNIPLISQQEETSKKKDNRYIISLEEINRTVLPLIISVNEDSSDEEKNHYKTVKDSKEVNFEKQVDNLLKQIRMQSETTSSTIQKGQININKVKENTPPPSAVNHLPRSSQLEYKMLLEKMKKLEELRARKQKSKLIRRSKSNTNITLSINQKINDEKKNSEIVANKQNNYTKKIEDTFAKIPLLDKDGRERLAKNAENKYLIHCKTLFEATDRTNKLVDENFLNIRRKENIDSKIDELEKSLTKYRSMKKVVEHRIYTGLPKIIQSQNDLIKVRNHQVNFRKLCSRVGQTVHGSDYSLPDNNGIADDIKKNLAQITAKCEKVQIAYSDHFAIRHLKNNLVKIRAFIKDKQEDTKDDQYIVKKSAINNDDYDNGEMKVILQVAGSTLGKINKRVMYESPLDFKNVTTSAPTENQDENRINEILCPLGLTNSCKDVKCMMLHI